MNSVGIIGGGPGGLIALYECKKRKIKATLYEKECNFGGVWNLNSKEPRSHCSTLFNTSYFVSTFDLDGLNDKRLNENDFFSSSQYFDYLRKIVEKYDLAEHIKNNREVLSITEDNNEFTVNILNIESLKREKVIHSHIILCTGRNGILKIPNEPFLSKEIIINKELVWHSSFWDPLNVQSKSSAAIAKENCRILVIGGSHSAVESIQDAINFAKMHNNLEGLKILWAPTRQPEKRSVWMMNRFPFQGSKSRLPADEKSCRLYKYFPKFIVSRKIREILSPIILHKRKALPDIMKDLLCIGDTPLIKNALGKGIIKVLSSPVLKIRKDPFNNIIFDTKEDNAQIVDVAILATGYTYRDIKINDEYILSTSKFYRGIIPLDERLKGRLGFIGTSRIVGSVVTVLQMEVRWLLYHLFNKKSSYVSILQNLKSKNVTETFVRTISDTSIEIPILRMDELANDMEMLPSIWRNMLSIRPYYRHVALACLLAPVSMHQYMNPIETPKEKYDREKYLLSTAVKSFKKANSNFQYVCILVDVVFYCSLFLIFYQLFLFLFHT